MRLGAGAVWKIFFEPLLEVWLVVRGVEWLVLVFMSWQGSWDRMSAGVRRGVKCRFEGMFCCCLRQDDGRCRGGAVL